MNSLNIEKIKNRLIYNFILPDFVNIFFEQIPNVAYYVNIQVRINLYVTLQAPINKIIQFDIDNIILIQILVKSTQKNINMSCNDALEKLKNLMQELSITEDELISP